GSKMPVRRLVRLSSMGFVPKQSLNFLETLKDTDAILESQAYFATSEALLRIRTASPGSGAPKMADPATRTPAPAWARAAALPGPTPPSTDSSIPRPPTKPLKWRSFAKVVGMKDCPPKPGFTDV